MRTETVATVKTYYALLELPLNNGHINTAKYKSLSYRVEGLGGKVRQPWVQVHKTNIIARQCNWLYTSRNLNIHPPIITSWAAIQTSCGSLGHYYLHYYITLRPAMYSSVYPSVYMLRLTEPGDT